MLEGGGGQYWRAGGSNVGVTQHSRVGGPMLESWWVQCWMVRGPMLVGGGSNIGGWEGPTLDG